MVAGGEGKDDKKTKYIGSVRCTLSPQAHSKTLTPLTPSHIHTIQLTSVEASVSDPDALIPEPDPDPAF